MVIFSTVLLNIYIVLLSVQVNGIVSTDTIRMPLLLFLIAESAGVLFFSILPKKANKMVHIPAVMGCAGCFTVYLVAYLFITNMPLTRVIELAFFPICLFITYINFIEIKAAKTFDLIIDIEFYYLIAVAITFLIAQVQRYGDFYKNANTVYYVIFALPFILQHKNRIKKWVGLGIILLCLFLSLKRTPLFAVALTLIFHNKSRKTTIKIMRRFFYISIAILLLDYIFGYFFDVHMLDRVLNMAEDGASGRIDLAKQTLELIVGSSYTELIFGHSLNSTSTVFDLGSHNDFLEMAYRMGAIGFSLFIGYFIGIIIKIIQYSKMKDYENANLLQSIVIMFAVISFSSQLIFLPTYIGLVGLAISLAHARHRFMVKELKNDIPESV